MARRGGFRGAVKGLRRAAVVLAACAATGCAIQTPADSDRGWVAAPQSIDASDWPERRPDCLDSYLADREIHPWPAEQALPEPAEPSDIETLRRELKRSACLRRLTLCGGDFVHRGRSGEGVVLESIFNGKQESDQFVVLLNRLEREALVDAIESDEPNDARYEGIDRFRFTLRRTTDGPSRGLIVHLISIGDLKYEDTVLRALRRDGWDTLTCVPRGFTIGFLDKGGSQMLTPAQVAARVDQYIASQACAIESMLLHLAESRPVDEPLVVTGFSLGALATPTVAARLGDRVKAVVMVGGGANIAKILVTGDLTQSLRTTAVRAIGSQARTELRALPEQYLDASRFDPYRTAPMLVDKPVLMLHAAFDAIVPASSGDLLYRRAGRPERWTYPLGHLGLFWMLPTQADRVRSWIDRRVAAAD